MNQSILLGNLGADPKMRTTPSGNNVTNFRVAVDRRYTRKGEEENTIYKTTDWFDIVAWNQLAKICHRHLQKGSQVLITGTLIPRQWEDRNGNRHRTIEVKATEVQFLKNIKASSKEENSSEEERSSTR